MDPLTPQMGERGKRLDPHGWPSTCANSYKRRRPRGRPQRHPRRMRRPRTGLAPDHRLPLSRVPPQCAHSLRQLGALTVPAGAKKKTSVFAQCRRVVEHSTSPLSGLNEGRGLQFRTSSAPPLTAGLWHKLCPTCKIALMEQLDLFAALERGLRAEERQDRVREFYARKSAEAKAAKAKNRRTAAARKTVEHSRATLARVTKPTGSRRRGDAWPGAHQRRRASMGERPRRAATVRAWAPRRERRRRAPRTPLPGRTSRGLRPGP